MKGRRDGEVGHSERKARLAESEEADRDADVAGVAKHQRAEEGVRRQLHRLQHREAANSEQAHHADGETGHLGELERRDIEAREASKEEAGHAYVQHEARNRNFVEVRARPRPGEPDERNDENGGYYAEKLQGHRASP
jgi:hypothetical protein